MPKQWESTARLVADLKRCDWKQWFADERAKQDAHDWPALVRRSVESNTFRAFAHLPKQPSVVFRDWGTRALAAGSVQFGRLLEVRDREAYDEWFKQLTAAFRRHWSREMGTEIGFGHSCKLPNLMMKLACIREEIPKRQSRRLISYLHVPLDSYTIQAVRNCTALVGNPGALGRIPASASMGYVKDLKTYLAFQALMRALAKQAGVPPIAIDVLAWNASHRARRRRSKRA